MSKLNLKSKKGMELTLSTVIIAVLLLVVLAVILFIFIGGMKRGEDVTGHYFKDLKAKDGDYSNVGSKFYKSNTNDPEAVKKTAPASPPPTIHRSKIT